MVYEQKRRLKMNFRLYCVVLLKKIIYENMSITLATKKIRDKGIHKTRSIKTHLADLWRVEALLQLRL